MKKSIVLILALAFICGVAAGAYGIHNMIEREMIAEEQERYRERAESHYEQLMALGLYLQFYSGNSVQHARLDDPTQYCTYLANGDLTAMNHKTYSIKNSAGDSFTLYVQETEYYAEKNIAGVSTWAKMEVPEERLSELNELISHIQDNATKGYGVFTKHLRREVEPMGASLLCRYYTENETMECLFTPEMRVDHMTWENQSENRQYTLRFIYADEYTSAAVPDDIAEVIDLDSVLDFCHELEKELT